MRQAYHKCSTLTAVGMDLNTSIVQTYDLVCQCHSDAITFKPVTVFTTIKQGKDMLFVLVTQTDSRIRHTDNHVPVPIRNMNY